jgi:hypothetical protein
VEKMDRTLLLNSDFTPISIIDIKRAFKMVYKNKAEIIIEKGLPISAGEKKYERPSVIRLLKYVLFPYKKIALSRLNIYKRDDYTCLYCGSKDSLTLDHVIPRSKGGKNTWDNLATCCLKCNVFKGDKIIDDIGMTLTYKPFIPTHLYFLYKSNKINNEWENFIIKEKIKFK